MGYLVIRRRVGERITIDDNIEILVYEITKSGRVDICIKAPKEVKIRRKGTHMEEEQEKGTWQKH